MTDFQNTVMTIATVILIICLIVVGVMIWNARHHVAWPPVVPECPNNYVGNGRGVCKAIAKKQSPSQIPAVCGSGKGAVSCSSHAARNAAIQNMKSYSDLDYDGFYNNSATAQCMAQGTCKQ